MTTIAVPGNYVTLTPNSNNSISASVTEPPPGLIGAGTENVTIDPNVTIEAIDNSIAMLTSLKAQMS